MYNAEIKMQYIQYCTENKNVRAEKFLPQLFSKTATIEKQLNKDLSAFTFNEIMEMYQSLYSTSFSSLMNIHSHLRDYANFCNLRNMLTDNINHYNEIDPAIIRKCLHEGLKKEQIVTRKELLDLLKSDAIRNPYEKVWILGVFEGIMGKAGGDLLHLRRGMIDFDNLIVHLPESGRELSISKELALLIDTAINETVYVTANGDKTRSFAKTDPDIVFKPSSNCRGTFATQNAFRIMLLRYNQSLDLPYLNTFALKTSGTIDYIRELMRKDGCNDPVATYQKHKSEVDIRYGSLTSFFHFELYAEEYQRPL